jgi:proline iminopeptidase
LAFDIHHLYRHPEAIGVVADWIYHAFWEASDKDVATFEDLLRQADAPDEIPLSLLALVDGQPAGTVNLIHSDDDTQPHLHPWLAALYVLPAYRGRGVASGLVRRLLIEAAQLGFSTVYVSTHIPTFYGRLGAELLEKVADDHYVMAFDVGSQLDPTEMTTGRDAGGGTSEAEPSLSAGERVIHTSDGVDLYVNVEGQGPLCLYVHGGPGSGSHWMQTFAGEMLGRHYTMVYLDQRGTGRSTSPASGDYSIERMVGDFEAVRAALEIEAWLTMGHSFAGVLQVAYAQRHPERIRGMIMLNCALDMTEISEAALVKACDFLGEDTPAEDTAVDEGKPLVERLMAAYGRMQEKGIFWKMGYASAESMAAMNATYAEIPNWNGDLSAAVMDRPEYLESYKSATASLPMPVLWYYGTRDWMIGPEHRRGVCFPLMLTWAGDVGHVAAIDNLPDLERAILAYRERFGL